MSWARPRSVAAALLLGATLGDASVSGLTLESNGDLCNGVCEFSICMDPNRARPAACDAGQTPIMTVIAAPRPSGLPGKPIARVHVLGTTVRLRCLPGALAPCQATCATDADCLVNGDVSRCLDGTCRSLANCPPRR
jgi:hypothetical protein